MPIKKYLNRVAQLDQLVRTKSTGTPRQVAKMLGLSRTAFFEFKRELTEDYGFPIAYCSVRQTYFYTEPGKMVDLSFQKLTKN